jgi:hypothetical protein
MDTSTVQHDGEPPRVTRVWQNHPEGADWSRDSDFEDGELQPDAIANARYTIGTIHATLQRHVTRGLNTEEQNDLNHEQPLEPVPEQPDPTAPLPSDIPTVATQEDVVVEGEAVAAQPEESLDSKAVFTLPGYGLDDEHTNLLERAIAVAAQAAQAQAEAEAALYEAPYDDDEQGDGEWNEELEDNHELGTEVEANKIVC